MPSCHRSLLPGMKTDVGRTRGGEETKPQGICPPFCLRRHLFLFNTGSRQHSAYHSAPLTDFAMKNFPQPHLKKLFPPQLWLFRAKRWQNTYVMTLRCSNNAIKLQHWDPRNLRLIALIEPSVYSQSCSCWVPVWGCRCLSHALLSFKVTAA